MGWHIANSRQRLQGRGQDVNPPRLRGRSWLSGKGMMKESKALRTFPGVPAVFDTLQVNAIPCSANYQTTYYKLLPV